jgi:hypothetical protein
MQLQDATKLPAVPTQAPHPPPRACGSGHPCVWPPAGWRAGTEHRGPLTLLGPLPWLLISLLPARARAPVLPTKLARTHHCRTYTRQASLAVAQLLSAAPAPCVGNLKVRAFKPAPWPMAPPPPSAALRACSRARTHPAAAAPCLSAIVMRPTCWCKHRACYRVDGLANQHKRNGGGCARAANCWQDVSASSQRLGGMDQWWGLLLVHPNAERGCYASCPHCSVLRSGSKAPRRADRARTEQWLKADARCTRAEATCARGKAKPPLVVVVSRCSCARGPHSGTKFCRAGARPQLAGSSSRREQSHSGAQQDDAWSTRRRRRRR